MRISDWSSDVCSSDLRKVARGHGRREGEGRLVARLVEAGHEAAGVGCLELSEQPANLLAADLVGIIEREKPVRLRVDRAGVAGSEPIFARRKRRGGDRKSTRLNSSH